MQDLTSSLEMQYFSRTRNESAFMTLDGIDCLLHYDATKYNHHMARFSIFLAGAAYYESSLRYNLDVMGFADIHSNYDINHMHDVAYTFAHHAVENVVAVIIRGTQGSALEWAGNFTAGGFHIAMGLVWRKLSAYIGSRSSIDRSSLRIWITGHSRGAAVAYLMGYSLTSPLGGRYRQEDVFVYTFAGPRVSLARGIPRKNIFNFINADDPLAAVIPGMQKPGRTARFSMFMHPHTFEYFQNLTGEAYRPFWPWHSHTPEAYMALLLATDDVTLSN